MKQLRVVYKPLGVVGIIVPWNGPFVLAMNQAAQAIVAGNAVLLKGSEVTPYSSALVGEFFAEAGLPDGVLEILMGDGQTGADLVDAGVDKISFTGSVATGRKVAEACGRQLIPVTLELGGKDAMIVCADADLDRAAAGALIGSCMNTGQYCCGTERIYAVGEIYDAFVEKVVEARARCARPTAASPTSARSSGTASSRSSTPTCAMRWRRARGCASAAAGTRTSRASTTSRPCSPT